MTPSIRRFIFSSILALVIPLIMLYYSYVPQVLAAAYEVHPARFLTYMLSAVFLFAMSETFVLKRISGYIHMSKSLSLYFAVLSFILFVFGTYLQSTTVQLAGMIATFVFTLGYLAGRGVSVLALPSFLFILLPSPTLVPAENVLSLLYLVLSIPLGYFSLRARHEQISDCDYCETYRRDGRNFCLYCGKLLNEVPYLFPSKKAAGILVMSLVLLGSFQVSLHVYTHVDGYPAVDVINLGSIKYLAPIPSELGVTFSFPQKINGTTGTVYVYNLTYGNILKQKAYFSTAKTAGAAQSQILIYTAARPLSTKPSSLVSNSLYTWNVSTIQFKGIMTYFPVKIMEGQNISDGFAAILVGEDTQSFVQEDGTSIRSLISAIYASSSISPFTNLLVSLYSSYLLKSASVVEAVFFVFLLLFFTCVARSLDLKNRRVFDGTLGLHLDEFILLAHMRKGSRKKSGRELMGIARELNPDMTWQRLTMLINRLKWLNVIEEEVSVTRDEPRLAWRFNV
ncbi:MAG: hypothetical protein QXV32_03770 [Conexivisphaerales archaeon]